DLEQVLRHATPPERTDRRVGDPSGDRQTGREIPPRSFRLVLAGDDESRDAMAGKGNLPVSFWLRTVRIGLQVTVLALIALVVSLLLPHDPAIHTGAFEPILAVAAVGGGMVAVLPWRRLLEGGLGIPFLYAWSVLDILLVSLAIWATGGARSELFVVYALTTVFFAPGYPARGQVGLLALTIVAYLFVLAVTGWGVTAS